MGGSSKKQTIGYRYSLGEHLVLCHGPIDNISEVNADERTAWLGFAQDGEITIDKPDLFGGENREGGIEGTVDIMLGGNSQTPNSYLQSQLGSDIPAFRGVVSIILKQVYLGMNPYLKKLSFRGQRVFVRQDGIEQWYVAKAPIYNNTENFEDLKLQIFDTSSGWKYTTTNYLDTTSYQLPDYDDSAWSTDGQMPFANLTGHPTAPGLGWPNSANTSWPEQTVLWVRKNFDLTDTLSFVMSLMVDNDCKVYINGTLVFDGGTADTQSEFIVPFSILNTGSNLIAIRANDTFGQGGGGNYTYLSTRVETIDQVDLNPAHIIRECLTDPDWGMGYAESDIDDTSFMAAADTLYDEQMGISLLWDQQSSIESFINEIIKHIDAVLYVDRSNGKFVLKLIRDDYDAGTLLVLDDSNIQKVVDLSRPTFGELTNSVTVIFWDYLTGKKAGVTLPNPAMIQMAGTVVSATIQYPGFTNQNIAARAGLRDLKTLSSSLWSGTIFTGSVAKNLTIGGVFKLEYGQVNAVMRITGIAYGDGKTNKIRIQAVQDRFELNSESGVSTPSPSDGWIPPTTTAEPSTFEINVETPYYTLVTQLGQSEVDARLTDEPDLGFMLSAAGRPDVEAILNAIVYVDTGSGYEESDTLDFSPFAFIDNSDGLGPTTTTIAIKDGVDLDLVEVGQLGQINDELIRVDAISTTSITLGRSILDTVPDQHADGDVILFWDDYATSDEVSYVATETINVKILPAGAENILDIEDATALPLTFGSRAIRPYPPGNLEFNSTYFPERISGVTDVVLTWNHRDRLQQTSGQFYDFEDGDIGPEAGTTYNVRIYGESDELGSENTGISGKTFTLSNSQEQTDFGYTSGSTPGDVDWASVVALLHFDGTDGDTTFTDEAGISTWSVTAAVAEIDDGFSKFSQSLLLNSVGKVEANSPGLIGLGTGDFTIEGWFRLNLASASTDYRWLLLIEGPWGNLDIRFGNTGFGGRLQFGVSTGTLAGTYSTQYTQSDLDDGVWRHLAMVRESSSVKFYLDGVLLTVRNNNYTGTPVTSFADSTDLSSPTSVKFGNTSPNSFLGNLEEFRFTKVARYTSNFTPPDAPFPNSASSSGTPRLSGRLRFEVESERDSYASSYKHSHTILRYGYGFNYGYYYGGA